MNGFNRHFSNEISDCPCLLKYRWESDSPELSEWIFEQFEVYVSASSYSLWNFVFSRKIFE